MAQPRDNGDAFKESWNAYTSYPTNLCRTIHFNHTLESYLSFLDECEKSRHAVFRRGRSKICVMDLADGDSVFEQPFSIRDSEQLDNRFPSTGRDPISRFIFIQARSNRDSLLCSKDQFSKIMTHHQVMPSFLDLATTFKRPEHGSGQSLFMTFHNEDFLSDADKSWNIPSLGRSGLQSQHCFNLIAPEYSKESLWKWPLRQTVSYHSFDPAEGRSCWVILKGNNLIQERLSKATQGDDPLKGSSLTSNEKRFIATLYAHLVIFKWCTEHWGHYIEYLEEQMTPVLKSKQVPVDSIVKMDHIDRSIQHQAIALSPRSTFARSGATSPPATLHASTMFSHAPARVSSLSNSVTAKIGKWPRLSLSRRHEGELVTNPESTVTPALVADPDKEFTFSQLQEQSRLADYGEEALLVMEQNLDIIREIKRRYQAIIEEEQFKAHIDVDACRSEIYAFGQRVRGVERTLENQRRRLQTRTRILSNNKDLYQVVLQFKNMKTSEYFATSAKVSSDEMHLMTEQMKEIAIKTEQETVSMHAITILTLGFLPSTFLAVRFGLPVLRNFLSATLTFCQTFFSSGIIQFEDGAEWVLRTDALRLFLAICLPLTALILLGWAVGYRRFRRSRRPQLTTLEYGELPLKREPERASGANRAQLV